MSDKQQKTINPNDAAWIDAGASLVGSGLSQIFGMVNQERQYNYNKAMLDHQWQNQIPTVVSSMRQAGLNKGLMYSNGGPSVGGSTGNVSAPTISNPLTGIGELLNQAELVKSQVRLNDETSQLRKEETNYKKLDSINKAIQNETDEEKKKNLIAEREKIYNDIEMDRRAADRADRKAESDIELNDSNIALNYQQLQRDIEMLPIDKENKKSLTALNKANASGVYKENAVRDSIIKLRQYEINKMKFETRKIYTEQLRTAYQFYYEQKYNRKMSSGVQATVDAVVSSMFGLKPEETITERYPEGKFNYFTFGAGSFIGRTKELFYKIKQLDQQSREALEPFAEWLNTIELP